MARICNVIGESHRVVRIPEALYHYRMRRGSITGDWSMQLTRDWVRATDDRETYIVERFPELKNFMKLQQLIFFVNLDYETIRQSLVAKFSIDPQDATGFVAASRDSPRTSPERATRFRKARSRCWIR